MPTPPEPSDTAQQKRLADKAGVPFLTLDPDAPGGVGVDENALAELDAAAARAFGVMPVRAEGGTLLVATADPTDEGTLAGLQTLTDLRVKVAVATREQIRRTQDALYGEPRPERPRQAPNGGALPPAPIDVEQRQRARQIALEAELPFVSLEPMPDKSGVWRDPVSHEAARRLGAEVCRAFNVVPIAAVGEGIALATADPSDQAAIKVAALLAGLRAWVVVATPGEIERAIFRVFGSASERPARRAGGEATALLPATEPVPEAEPAVEPQAPGGVRLGEMLLSQGKLSDEQLEQALELQRRQGDRLGEILMHTGVVPEVEISTALAEQQQLSFTDLAAVEPNPETHTLIPEQVAQRYRIVPLAMVDGVLHLAMADALDEEAMSIVTEHVDSPVRAFVAPPTSVELLLQRIYAKSNAEIAAASLLLRRPEESAHKVLSKPQKLFFGGLLVFGLICLAIWPLPTIIAFNIATIIFYASFLVYRFRLTYHSFGHEAELPVSQEEIAALDERTLPIYTILVPLYREAAVLPRLVALDRSARLPAREARREAALRGGRRRDDRGDPGARPAAALQAGHRARRRSRRPSRRPATTACSARGRVRRHLRRRGPPRPDQLKKVVVAFRRRPRTSPASRASSTTSTSDQNLLTRWFSIEYAMLFDLMLPGLDAARTRSRSAAPRTTSDRDGWSSSAPGTPSTSTEDADLGIRLHKPGYRTAMMDSTTLEEANSELDNWIRQRSRWIKGYIQTWLVHMRHPIRLLREVGLRELALASS